MKNGHLFSRLSCPQKHSDDGTGMRTLHAAEYPGGTSTSSGATSTFDDDADGNGCPFASKRTPESAWYVPLWGKESNPDSAALLYG